MHPGELMAWGDATSTILLSDKRQHRYTKKRLRRHSYPPRNTWSHGTLGRNVPQELAFP